MPGNVVHDEFIDVAEHQNTGKISSEGIFS